MKVNRLVPLLLPIVSSALASASETTRLRRRAAAADGTSGTATTNNANDEWPTVPDNTPGISYHYAMSKQPWDSLSGGRLKTFEPPSEISNVTMAIANLELYPGGV